jgi:hypothetical protein
MKSFFGGKEMSQDDAPLKVRHVEIVKNHAGQCCYCHLEDKLVEAGGVFFCPNPICMGPGGAWFRSGLDSFRLVDGGRHSVETDEWERKGDEYLKDKAVLAAKIRRLYEPR